MKLIPLRFLALLALALGLAVQAQQPQRNVDELMRKSGLWKQVAAIGENVRPTVARMRAQTPKGGPGDLDDATFESLIKAMERAYEPDRVRGIVAAELAKLISVDDEKTVIAWLDSDLGRRMTAIEEQRGDSKADFQENVKEAAKYFSSAPRERVALAERFGAALNAGESEADMVIEMMAAMLYGLSLADPRVDEASVRMMKGKLGEQRPQLVELFRKMSTSMYAHTYREVPVEDLTRYVDFIESPAGLRYHDATTAAVRTALTRGALDMGRLFGETLPKNPTRS